MTVWKQWFSTWLWRWLVWRHRRFETKLTRHTTKYKDILPIHYALQARLTHLDDLPSIPYHYRIGQRIRFEAFYTDWGVWQTYALMVAEAVKNNGYVDDAVARAGANRSIVTLDHYLRGYEAPDHTLDDFRHELIRDGLELVETLRIAEAIDDPSRSFYYQTRAKRLVKDLDEVVHTMTETAMEARHVK